MKKKFVVEPIVWNVYNRLVKFELKIPNCLGKMSENLRGDFLTYIED